MKKFIKILLIIFVMLIGYLLIPRTKKQMEKVVYYELKDYLGRGFDTTNYNVKGPILHKGKDGYYMFQWYKVLPWGDSASIFFDVPKTIIPLSLDRIGDYFLPQITMNYQWNYLLGPISKFDDILPTKYRKEIFINTQLKPYPNHKKCFDSAELTISPERLFFFLKEGYFRILKKEDDYTVVEFYEPIGNVFYKNGNKQDTMFTLGAKVYVNEAFEVLIIPYKIPNELW